MEAIIKFIQPKKLVGKSLKMSLTENSTAQLWGSFMPRVKEVANRITTNKFSLQVYEPNYFKNFNPSNEFVKWALVEVADFDNIPEGLETFELLGGQYAVFIHKGDATTFYKTAQFIFDEWLPNSAYVLDDRPHFEVLGEKTKRDDPTSEEEVWIPIKAK
jgi:AraC family transcriptional regulator